MRINKIWRIKPLLIAVLLLGFSSQLQNATPLEHPRKIVVFKKSFIKVDDQDTLLENSGAVKVKHLRLINSSAAYLSPQAEKALRKKAEVLRIDEDLVITAVGKKDKGKDKKKVQPLEELTWGIDRINADWAWPISTGATIRVAVLDTGIDLDHPDLLDNVKGSVNLIKPKKSADDDNGHGTHVAGIIAASDNDIGVIGTGPEIYLYAVKVLDKKGKGWLSDLIEGLEWCIQNEVQVINMSLGSSEDNQSFYEAILNAYAAGITLVAAAGNNGDSGGSIDYPAKYTETITASAVDQFCQFALFSSFGPEIDITAPGVDIKSTYIKGSYITMSGTSMAAAHVTGVVALVLTTSPLTYYDVDGDGVWDPGEVKMRLRDTAEELALPPYQQGAGLARADNVLY
ncbi:MAG: S8 family peptidase [Candidatus Aminicenantes bacterium]|jgi:subtilisin family serine protease